MFLIEARKRQRKRRNEHKGITMAKKKIPTPVSLSATLKKEMQRKFNFKKNIYTKGETTQLGRQKAVRRAQQDTIKEMYKAHPQLMKRATKTTLTRLLSGKSRLK